jgi:hypothetical protein
MNSIAAQSDSTRAEDRATLRSDPSADPGVGVEGRAGLGSGPVSLTHLQLQHQSDKPARHEAGTRLTRRPSPLANANCPKFHFPLNQDTFCKLWNQGTCRASFKRSRKA